MSGSIRRRRMVISIPLQTWLLEEVAGEVWHQTGLSLREGYELVSSSQCLEGGPKGCKLDVGRMQRRLEHFVSIHRFS